MADRIFRAPGRVNLIGEHTDYNEGLVLPAALDLFCEVRASRRTDALLNASALNLNSSAFWKTLSIPSARPRGDWSDYVAGTAQQLERRGIKVSALNLAIRSDVPLGAGLSSSAALEVAVGMALVSYSGRTLGGAELAKACQQAEAEFVGLQCGIMDQFVAVFGRRGHALLLDCRTLEHRLVPLPAEVELVMVNSGVRHELASTAYNERRRECEAAVRILGRSLRDVSIAEWPDAESALPEPLRRRARHVVYENQRVLDFVAACERRDLTALGRLMRDSHHSLARDYEVSCFELDFLVETAAAIDGVVGCRLTGGGFGGCTVNLVRPGSVESFRRKISAAYCRRFGHEPAVYVCSSADGAREIAA
ncbi:MAG: galactokinase [Acidobacteria bacterium]|nr:galactokinase [Acidobacteriota bacterium]